jgi:hypothetical protein
MSTSGPLSQPAAAITEVVDMQSGSVRVCGHLTVQGAERPHGIVETMRRGVHTTVLLDLQRLQAADDVDLQLLPNVRESVTADGGKPFVLPSPTGLTRRLG